METGSRGCFCGWWHHDGDDYAWQARCNLEPEANQRALEHAIDQGEPRASGVVACHDDRVLGWLKLAPAAQMGKLVARRVYRTLSCFDGDRSDIWVIGCMLVHPDHRRSGIGGRLVAGAVELARAKGGRAIEAMPRRAREAVRDDELWMGPPTALEQAGFVQIDGPDPYPVMRLELVQ
jgi:GNAT superfamily N-acetyltransferase